MNKKHKTGKYIHIPNACKYVICLIICSGVLVCMVKCVIYLFILISFFLLGRRFSFSFFYCIHYSLLFSYFSTTVFGTSVCAPGISALVLLQPNNNHKHLIFYVNKNCSFMVFLFVCTIFCSCIISFRSLPTFVLTYVEYQTEQSIHRTPCNGYNNVSGVHQLKKKTFFKN